MKKRIHHNIIIINAYRNYAGNANKLSNNLGVMQENIQDAESTTRDTDVADEMAEYTRNNILLKSAQADQMPQGVLQLLQ